MNSFERIGILGLFVAILTACVSPYEPPKSGPTANLHFIGNQVVAILDYGSCSNRQKIYVQNWGGADPAKESRFQDYRKPDWGTSKIPAGQRMTIEMGSGGSTSTCYGSLSFIPKEDATYIAEFKYAVTKCFMTIDVVSSNGTRTPDPTIQKEQSRNCF